MGRNNQISSSAQRQATQLHQQSAMQAKTSTQSAPIKQQLQQQKAAAVPARPASPQSQAAQAQSKGQSQSATMKQQQRPASPQMKQQQQNPINNKNAQVYRPTPVQEHPDDAFLSGAWMFDAQRVPQWMSSQLHDTHSKRNLVITAINCSNLPKSHLVSKKKPAIPSKKNDKTKTSIIRIQKLPDVHSDTGFETGAWMYDATAVPLWMQLAVPTVATALVVRPRALCCPLPTARASQLMTRARRIAAGLSGSMPPRVSFGANNTETYAFKAPKSRTARLVKVHATFGRRQRHGVSIARRT